MNTRELRIGNYVSVGGKIVKVNGITQNKIGYCPEPGYERYARSREVEPVQITHDILSDACNNHNNVHKFEFRVFYDGSAIITFTDNNQVYCCRRLHWLQNLYFMMWGEELVVKQPQ